MWWEVGGSSLILLCVGMPLSQHHVLKRLPSHWMVLTPLSKIFLLYLQVFISGLCLLVHYCFIVVSSEIGNVSIPFVLLF